ncbi:unnamed protein product [Rhizophagus irregularis]|nr:unnamed protein product [Rhizophagus irregularis]CAB5366350.1 unnamed protein product [Rhizophagus irregularis]
MSSTPYIEIDWSSTPQQPYPQLGDFTPPENNSAEILYNTEQPTVFSAKDTPSLDIEDIYPYTFSTSHREDNETETYPDDEDYFQELLKANLNAEIEVISVLKNNIPPVYNTPLTPIQDNTPLPPLATAPLSENLCTTGKKTTLLTSTDFINNKSSHANLLYYRCLNGKLKRITSRRLGISYDSNIHARDPSTKLKVNNRHMYRKRLSNFQYNLSPNIRTQKHQDIRFKRTCRRIFNKMHLPSNRKATNQDYLAIARKYRFLFLKSQYVNTPIRHLLYKHSDSIPTANDYPFLVPYFAMDSNHKKQIMTRLTNASTSTGPSAPPDNYNPIPDIYIPEKYHDIIPKDPIYVNDRYIVPGSREWFTYMYNVDESYYPPESKTPKYDRKGKYIPRNPIYRSGVVENFVPSHIVTKAQRARPKKLKTVISLTEAAYHGTTPKHYPTRINEIESLTEATDSFHNRIPHYLAKRAENHRIGSSTTSMDKSLTKFLRNNNLRSQGTMQFLRYRYTDVSDETAEVEYRPNKRDDIHNENHYFSFQDHTTKRLRPTPATNNDSLVPGPSRSKTI